MKKKIYVLSIIVLILLMGILICVISKKDKDNKEITRYEWIQMLCNEFGVVEYESETPYFLDVQEEDIYYRYIQSAVEWGLLNAEKEFVGDDYATGKFVTLTAIRSICEDKMQIYLKSEEKVTDEVYLQVALDLGLINNDDLYSNISKKDAESLLNNVKKCYYDEFWIDDYEDADYCEDVVEIELEHILQSNEDITEIVMAENIISALEEEKVIIFSDEDTGLKYARKIVSIDDGGKLKLSDDIYIEEILNSLILSDLKEVSFKDIVNYILYDDSNVESNIIYKDNGVSTVNTGIYSKEIESKGFKIKLLINDDRKLEIEFTDNDTNITVSKIINITFDDDLKFDAEIEVDKIFLGAQVKYSIWDGIKYADVVVDSHASITGTIEGLECESKIPLFKTPVPLGSGLVGVDIQISLVISAEGSISFVAEIPVEASIYYEKDKNIRNINNEILVENPTLEGNCNAGVALQFEATLVILGCIDVVDVQVDLGIVVSANMKTHTNGQVCIDTQIAFPTLTISVCGDDDADTLLGELGVSAEWEILNEDNTFIQIGWHYEIYPNGEFKYVDKCTYGKETVSNQETEYEIEISEELTTETGTIETETTEKINNELTDISRFYGYNFPLRFVVRTDMLQNDLIDNFEEYEDYYIVEGTLECLECIEVTKLGLREENGCHFETVNGNGYTYIGQGTYGSADRIVYYLLGDDGEDYTISNIPAFGIDIYTSKSYYMIRSSNSIITKYPNVKIRIEKDTQVRHNDRIFYGDGSFSSYLNSSYALDIPFYEYDIRFDENGEIIVLDASNRWGQYPDAIVREIYLN